jgi:peptide/nickel transport system permease protein
VTIPVAELKAAPRSADPGAPARRSRTLWRARRSALSWVGIAIVLLLVGVAILGPYLVPYPQAATSVVDFGAALMPPSSAHLMGTDDAGRDLFSRVIIGARISLITGLLVVGIGSLVGVAVGLVGGYLGGIVNVVLMRVADVFLAIPSVALALAITAALRPSLQTTMLAISLVWWPWMARLVQAEVLSVKEESFVDASRTYGASHLHILLRDILPNVTSVIVVKATLDIGFAILLAAALGFLGVGVQPPTPEWGSMIATGRLYLPGAWWLSTFPGLAIFIAVLGFNLFGDTVRDVLDVKYEA